MTDDMDLRLANLELGCEELHDLGHHDITAKLLVLHVAPKLKGRDLRRAMHAVRDRFPTIRAWLAEHSRVVPVAQPYFDHPTRLPQKAIEARTCLAVDGRATIGLHFVPDGTDDILWTVYHETYARRQFASGLDHIAKIRDAEEAGNALPGDAREAVDAATRAAQRRIGGRSRRWDAIADKTARALQITGDTTTEVPS